MTTENFLEGLNKIYSAMVEGGLIIWASVISTFFFISSIIGILDGGKTTFPVYVLALLLLLLHFLIRQKFPQRFTTKSKDFLAPFEKLDELFTDLVSRSSVALASSVAIFSFLWEEKIAFFINDWKALAEKVAFSLFVSSALILIFIVILPLTIAFLVDKLISKTYNKMRIKKLAFAIILLFVLLLFIYSEIQELSDKPTLFELIIERLTQEKIIISLTRFLMGIPLIFWLEYLFLGNNLFKAKR